jgi:membrane associated rhomboid family serine protease
MLIPIGHENMRGRRWPVITIGLIALNVLIFLGTHWTIEDQSPKAAEAKLHILLLAATHPEVNMPPDIGEFVHGFEAHHATVWKELQSPNRNAADEWDARTRRMEDPEQIQGEMDTLVQQYQQLQQESILERYGFVPGHPRPLAYVTANFLHGGWLHLIGNMWFLWLAGLLIEDTWGRVIYPIFYFLAGAIALQFHAWSNPGSIVPTLGASGAVAALMGAFLVRYPNVRIKMAWIFFLRPRYFQARAIWLLPLWLLMEVFYGTLFGQATGVAHWAHVGGFLFGVLAAVGIRYSGLEKKADQAIEEKIGWTADPRIVVATELMEKHDFDGAIASLKRLQAEQPDSLDAATLLSQICFRKGDQAGHRQALLKLCQLHLKTHNAEAAWQEFQEFLNIGGENPPAGLWLEMARYLENQQNLERAVSEYQSLAEAYPAEKQALLALLSAGRLSLKSLHRPSDALRFYQAAAASPITHLDWESNIQTGIQAAQAALSGSYASTKVRS